MSESGLERGCTRLVNKRGGVLLKLQMSRGWPDRILMMPGGKLVFVELKRPGKNPTALQAWVHGQIRGLGFRCLVIRTIKEMQLEVDRAQLPD